MDAFEAGIEYIRRFLARAIDLAIRNFADCFGNDCLELGSMRHSFFHFIDRDCRGCTEGNDAGNVGGATSPSHLLSSAEEVRLEVDFFLVKEADALWRVEFVSTCGNVINIGSVGGKFAG